MLSKPKIKPPILNKGDKVALVTPAGPITRQELEKAADIVRNAGLVPVWSDTVLSQTGYLAGDDSQRAGEIMDFWHDEQVKAVFCVRGGYGTTRILNMLDYIYISEHPKLFMGFSDITALNAAFYQKSGLVTLHGSLKALSFEHGREFFENVVFSRKDNYEIKPIETDEGRMLQLEVLCEGSATGELIGGNLSLLTALTGTEYMPRFEGKITFIEEISEPPYKIDRMLTHLFMATDIAKSSAIVLGIFNKCRPEDYKVEHRSFSLKEIFVRRFSDLGIPVIMNYPFGHIKKSLILPYGAKVELDTGNLYIKLKESLTDEYNA